MHEKLETRRQMLHDLQHQNFQDIEQFIELEKLATLDEIANQLANIGTQLMNIEMSVRGS